MTARWVVMIIDEREERAVEEGEEVEADRSRVIARRGFVSFETRKIRAACAF